MVDYSQYQHLLIEKRDGIALLTMTRPEVMNQIFLDVGLEDVRTTSFDTVVTYKDFDDYWNSNTAIKYPILNSINEMTDEDRERFMTEVKALVPIALDGPEVICQLGLDLDRFAQRGLE